MTPPLVIPPYLKEAPLTGLIGMGGGATSRHFYTASSSDSYQITKSVRFNDNDAPYLTRNPKTSNRRKFTIATWYKFSRLKNAWYHGTGQGSADWFIIGCEDSDGNLTVKNKGGSDNMHLKTTQVFRDFSAWFHVVVAIDTTQDTAADRAKIYINGKQVTSFEIETYPAQHLELSHNRGDKNYDIGRQGTWGSQYHYDGLLADYIHIDGLQLSPASLGSFDSTGVWNPKAFGLPASNDGTTWSSDVTSESGAYYSGNGPAQLFNGVNGGAGNMVDADSQDKWVKWTPSGGKAFTTSVRIYHGGSANDYTLKLDDGRTYIKRANLNDWTTLCEGAGTIEYIENQPDGSVYNNWSSIEVDGVILEDGVTDPTTRNNPNNGTVWSSNTCSGTPYSGQVFTSAFDGLSTTYVHSQYPGVLKWVPPSTITGKLRCLIACGAHGGSVTGNFDFKINGVSKFNNSTFPNNASAWVNFGEVSIAAGGDGIEWGSQTGGNWMAMRIIEIDGHPLLDGATDNSFHLKFDDTSLNRYLGKDTLNGKIADATGGLPIYNTTDDYGDVKGSGYRADSDKANLMLAIPGDSITDVSYVSDLRNSGSAKTLSAQGDAAVSTNRSRFYGSAITMDGTGDYIQCGSSSDYAFGTGDFCVEFWWYQNDESAGSTQRGVAQCSETAGGLSNSFTNGWAITTGLDADGTTVAAGLRFKFGPSGNHVGTESNNRIAIQQWQHIAFTRSSGTARFFIDGRLVDEESITDDLTATNLAIGGYYSTSYLLKGEINDFRIYKTAKYTANFKPPTRNDFVVNNISTTAGTGNDSLTDTPTNYGTDGQNGGEVRGNYATLNPLQKYASTLSQGNLFGGNTDNTDGTAYATIRCPNSGVWYCEATFEEWTAAGNNFGIGVDTAQTRGSGSDLRAWSNVDAKSRLVGFNDTNMYSCDGSGGGTNIGTLTLAQGDVWQCCWDVDNGKLYYGKNNTWYTSSGPSSGAAFNASNHFFSETFLQDGGFFYLNAYDATGYINFGQRPWAYTPPLNAKALCTQNLSDTFGDNDDTNNPSKYFDIALWTGNGDTAQTIKTGLLSPDMVWFKERSNNSSHAIVDRLRGGTNAAKVIYPDRTDTEVTGTSTSSITSLDSDGFTIGSSDGSINANGDTYVGWAWDCGTAVASTTNSGSATNYTRWTNTTTGFSIIKATISTGSGVHSKTIDHGLGVAPEFILGKGLDAAEDWRVYHVSNGFGGSIYLNKEDAFNTSDAWKVSATSNSQFTFDSYGAAQNMIYYVWAPIKGYSAFGEYTGNGDADGPFVYCGFKPKYLMTRNTGGSSRWVILDTERHPYNGVNNGAVWAERNDGESVDSENNVDYLSNGFKMRCTNGNANGSGSTYIWAAFAEHPLKTARAQ